MLDELHEINDRIGDLACSANASDIARIAEWRAIGRIIDYCC